MPGSHKLTNELGCRLGEKGPRSGVLTPAPCEKYAKEELNILQLNINGLQNKKIELVKLLQDKEVHIALLQETILPKKITIPGYTLAPTVKASWHLLEMTLLEKQKISPTMVLIGKKQQSGQSQEQNLPSTICTVHLVQTQAFHS